MSCAGRPAPQIALVTCPPWTPSGTRGRWLCRRWRHGFSPSTWSAHCGWGSWGLPSLLTGRLTCCFTCFVLIIDVLPVCHKIGFVSGSLTFSSSISYYFTCAGCSLSWWGPVPPFSSSAAGGANAYHQRRMPLVNPPLPVTGARVYAPAVLPCLLV